MSHNSNIAEFGTLCPHRAVGTSGKENSMARKRYQNGRVFLRERNKKNGSGDIGKMWWESQEQQSVFGVPLFSARSASCRQNGSPSVVWPPYLPVSTASTTGPDVRLRSGSYRTVENRSANHTKTILCASRSLAPKVLHHSRGWQTTSGRIWRREPTTIYNSNAERSTDKVVSRKTVLNVIATISTILATARNWGYSCEQIDMKKLRLPPRGVASEARHFTIEQVQRILALAGEPWRTLFCICTLDGLRAGEALGLQWGDIDLDQRILQIRRTAWYGKTQTPKSRESETTLPIPDALAGILKNYRSEWKPNPDGFLFVTRNERPPSSNNVVEHRLWPILDALEIPRCGLHAFRHTHTALLLDSGATPKVVQRQLRHADARTTLQITGTS